MVQITVRISKVIVMYNTQLSLLIQFVSKIGLGVGNHRLAPVPYIVSKMVSVHSPRVDNMCTHVWKDKLLGISYLNEK